jgi:hypothetical protein
LPAARRNAISRDLSHWGAIPRNETANCGFNETRFLSGSIAEQRTNPQTQVMAVMGSAASLFKKISQLAGF